MSTDESELIEYCLGTLDPERARKVELARDEDPAVAHALAEIAHTLGAVGEAAPRLSAPPSLRERVVGSLHPQRRLNGFAARLAKLFAIDLDNARSMLAQAAKVPAAPWTRTPLPGTFVLDVNGSAAKAATKCMLVYLERGATIPRHRHRGVEHMLILDGYAEEDSGRRVGPGDEIISDSGSEHEFDIVVDTPCLIAIRLEQGVDWVRWKDKVVFACTAILNRLRGRR